AKSHWAVFLHTDAFKQSHGAVNQFAEALFELLLIDDLTICDRIAHGERRLHEGQGRIFFLSSWAASEKAFNSAYHCWKKRNSLQQLGKKFHCCFSFDWLLKNMFLKIRRWH